MPSSMSLLSFLLILSWSLQLSCTYIAQPRTDQESTLIGSYLMIYGGQTQVIGVSVSNELIILPISQSFDTTVPPYLDSSGPRDTGPNVNGGVILPGGQDHDELFLYGGNIDGGVQLAIYNQASGLFKNASWPTGTGPTPRDSHSAATNITAGKAYIFGGETNIDAGTALNDLWILDTILLQWTPILSNIPLARQAHTATLTTDGRMVVIGGQTNPVAGQTAPPVVSLSYIDIFDTISQQWSNQNASNPPVARLSHTAVCTNINQILVYGGDNGSEFPLGDFAMLDMNTLPLTWIKPNTTGEAPLPRFGHSATMVGTIMFIIYGQVGNTTLDSSIYAMDTTTFSWTNGYTPNHLEYTWPASISISTGTDNNNNTPAVNSTSANSNAPSTGLSTVSIAILSGVVGGAVVIIAIIVAIFFICGRAKRPRNRRPTEQEISENANDFFPQTRPTIPNNSPQFGTGEEKQNFRRPVYDSYDGSGRPPSTGSNPVRSSVTDSQGRYSGASYENFGMQQPSSNTSFTSLTSYSQNPDSPYSANRHLMQPQNQLQTVYEQMPSSTHGFQSPPPFLDNSQRYSQYQDSRSSPPSSPQQRQLHQQDISERMSSVASDVEEENQNKKPDEII